MSVFALQVGMEILDSRRVCPWRNPHQKSAAAPYQHIIVVKYLKAVLQYLKRGVLE